MIYKLQTGGGMQSPSNPEEVAGQIMGLVQAVIQSQGQDQDAMSQVAGIVQEGIIKQNPELQEPLSLIMQSAQQGDEQAKQAVQLFQQIAQSMQGGQAQKAAMGGQLAYIHYLRTGTNLGEGVVYQRCGGTITKRVVKKRCGGKAKPVMRRKPKKYFD